jgi:peptide/nickel transport system ATP-binding protein
LPPLLSINNLTTQFSTSSGILKAVDGVYLRLDDGETLAIVGESGCGKSVTAYSIMRLVAAPGKIVAGEVLFEGIDLLQASEETMRQMRGNRISMIFQEPMSSLNPVLKIGDQIMEGLLLHRQITRKEAETESIRMLTQVGIPSASSRINDYPHRLSGGMRQRVMIAMALACQPRILIADEPTTALDVTIQAQILDLIDRMQQETGMALMLITHDLGIVAEKSVNTAIMYAGKIVEYAPTAEIFRNPLHPYTVGLLNSLPQKFVPGEPLQTIPGQVPNLAGDIPGCGFCPRCTEKSWTCHQEKPAMKELAPGHHVCCWKYS